MREQLRARIVCPSCHRSVVMDPGQLRTRYWSLRGGDALEDVGRLMRCQACHHRGAKIEPSTLKTTSDEDRATKGSRADPRPVR